jgi:hypothetical protein
MVMDGNILLNEDRADKYVRRVYDAIIDNSACFGSSLRAYPQRQVLFLVHNVIAGTAKFQANCGRRGYKPHNRNYNVEGKELSTSNKRGIRSGWRYIRTGKAWNAAMDYRE